jgi:hypothetical protein
MNPEWIRGLATTAAFAPSADNSQPLRMRWTGSNLVISFASRNQEAPVFTSGSHASLVAAGALIENLDAALKANAINASWQWPERPEKGQPYVSVSLHGGNPPSFNPPEGPRRRHTNRFAFRRDPLPADVIQKLEASREDAIRALVIIEPAQKSGVVRLVRLASEARFCNRSLHEWLMDSLRFTPEEVARGDGLDIRTLGLPPGGEHFLRFISDWDRLATLNRLGAYKLLAAMEVGMLKAAPALICVVGPDGVRNTIDAGRLMTRLWTDLNLKGIAVHPYYVVTDQLNRLRAKTLAAGFDSQIERVDAEMHKLLKLQSGETLHMLLRVGYPKNEPTRSRRLPLEAVFIDETRPGAARAG